MYFIANYIIHRMEKSRGIPLFHTWRGPCALLRKQAMGLAKVTRAPGSQRLYEYALPISSNRTLKKASLRTYRGVSQASVLSLF